MMDRSNDHSTLKLSANSTLREFLTISYSVGKTRDANRILTDKAQGLSPSRMQKLHTFERKFSGLLGRDALVADLNSSMLKRLVLMFDEMAPSDCRFFVEYQALWSYAAKLGLVKAPKSGKKKQGRLPRFLSSEPGTLWAICCKQYFPKNLSIRSEKTKKQYRIAMVDFSECLGHQPMAEDLTEDNILAFMKWMQNKGRAAKTINERRGRIHALWNWMAKRKLVDSFPTVPRMPEPRRTPVAWTQAQLRALIESCRQEAGVIDTVPAWLWWTLLHYVLWDTGERIGAVMAFRWEWVNLATGFIHVPAEVRKRCDRDMVYKLHPETVTLMLQMPRSSSGVIFPWIQHEGTFYNAYKRILRRANLPTDAKSKTHRMRRSVATHLTAAGVNATEALGHAGPEVTRRSYIDPTIATPPNVADHLFRIGDGSQKLDSAATASILERESFAPAGRTLGEIIGNLLEARGWNREDLSNEAGIAPWVLTRIMRDHRRLPSKSTIRRIAKALGVPIEDLQSTDEGAAGRDAQSASG